MKTINLRFNDRIGVRGLLNAKYIQGGLTLDTLKDATHLLEKVSMETIWAKKPDKDGTIKAIGGEEAKKLNLRRLTSKNLKGEDVSQLIWDVKQDTPKAIEITADEVKLLKEIIQEKNDKKEIKLDDLWLADVSAQLNDN